MNRYINKASYYFKKYLVSKFKSNFKINYKGKGLINLIDIGSFGGLPEPWFSNASKVKFLVNFEPNNAIKEGVNYITFNTAVWEREERKTFYIYKGFRGTGSSLFEQNYEYVQQNYEELKKRGPKNLAKTWFERSKILKTVEIDCNTLDSIILKKFPETNFDFIKIDAQGAELNILKGSEKLLENCIGLHLELFTIPMYKEIALIDEVERYLSKLGFKLAIKFPPHGTFNSQNDCVFLKTDKNESEKFLLIKDIYNIK